MNLEDDLRRALARTSAPPQLVERVAKRIAEGTPSTGGSATSRHIARRRWAAAVAATLLVSVGGVRYYQQQQVVAEAERVEAEIRLALQITREKLDLIQRKVNDEQP